MINPAVQEDILVNLRQTAVRLGDDPVLSRIVKECLVLRIIVRMETDLSTGEISGRQLRAPYLLD